MAEQAEARRNHKSLRCSALSDLLQCDSNGEGKSTADMADSVVSVSRFVKAFCEAHDHKMYGADRWNAAYPAVMAEGGLQFCGT